MYVKPYTVFVKMSIFLVDVVSHERSKSLENTIFWRQDHFHADLILKNIYPDTHIVASPEDKREIAKIDKIIFELSNDNTNVLLSKMKTSSCHENVHTLLKKRKIQYGYTGYALSEDGLWRLHSWGVDHKGMLIETTVLRVMYIGLTKYENISGLVLPIFS